jgi:hypothetical protein
MRRACIVESVDILILASLPSNLGDAVTPMSPVAPIPRGLTLPDEAQEVR